MEIWALLEANRVFISSAPASVEKSWLSKSGPRQALVKKSGAKPLFSRCKNVWSSPHRPITVFSDGLPFCLWALSHCSARWAQIVNIGVSLDRYKTS